MMKSVSHESVQGVLWSERGNVSSNNDNEAVFSTRKVVSRDEKRHFSLIDQVDPKNAKGALKKFGKIKTVGQIGVFIKELFRTKSFKLASVAVKTCRLSVLNDAIAVSETSLKDRKTKAVEAYNHIKASNPTGGNTLEQESEYIKGMVNLLNEPDVYSEPSFGQDGLGENIQNIENYLLSQKEMDEMLAARELLESSMREE